MASFYDVTVWPNRNGQTFRRDFVLIISVVVSYTDDAGSRFLRNLGQLLSH